MPGILLTTLIVVIFSPFVLGLGSLTMAPPGCNRAWTYLKGIALSVLIVGLPLFVFILSAFLVPDCKAACSRGWLNCFHIGKLALTPVILWATAALYASDVLRIPDRSRQWLVSGVFLGAITSLACFIIGLLICDLRESWDRFWLCVPGYVSIWYSIRAVRLMQTTEVRLGAFFRSAFGSLPFWIASVLWSRDVYASLPNEVGGCFVVTAAARGHRSLVGPFFEIERHGRRVRVNYQLFVLRRFEDLWRHRAPTSHRVFREVYNCFGPKIAKRIASPWLADFVWLALKPAEIVAGLALRFVDAVD
jgi:hypothetical protein